MFPFVSFLPFRVDTDVILLDIWSVGFEMAPIFYLTGVLNDAMVSLEAHVVRR